MLTFFCCFISSFVFEQNRLAISLCSIDDMGSPMCETAATGSKPSWQIRDIIISFSFSQLSHLVSLNTVAQASFVCGSY